MSVLEIRSDLTDGHQAAWERIAHPGTWWSGAERVAIAAAARAAWTCRLCDLRSSSLSPNAGGPDAKHDPAPGHDGVLPESAVDAAHRLVRDQGRLSGEWLESATDAKTFTKKHYVELLGVLTQVVSMDVFRLAAGLPIEDLPAPQPGEPTRYTPQGLAMETAWVPMIQTQNLGPNEKDLYGKTGNVIRAMSSVPDEVRALRKLSSHHYLAFEQMFDFVGGERVGRAIDRAQMELVAGRVSALHECFY